MLGILEQRYFPEGRGARRRTRLGAWAVCLALLLLVSLGGYAAGYAYDLWSTESLLREQRAAEAEADQERAPFTSSVTYDTALPEGYKIVLDRPLTEEEGEQLQSTESAEVWEFLRPLGGRLVRNLDRMSAEPAGGWSWRGEGGSPAATVFTMNLLSARSSQLSIVDMTPVNISCAEPTAVTVVDSPPSGEASYPGVTVDLHHDDPQLYIADEGPDREQPYFSRRRIDLGGGLDPGGLRVEAVVHDRSCEWELNARYVDARENEDEVVLRDGDRPFFAEALPRRPEQYWVAGFTVSDTEERAFVSCDEVPEAPSCQLASGSGG
ncbi:hypothetical protein NGM33_01150 [Nocardiopsis dassonvillei]|uniref:hypothetical protein n=1 Tax=Nocardiopsis dassonvillei TaxID=2014 RepID=UPI00102BA31C|nr:hypothetical protein [Nocardiopsis dassonvillei]MCP3011920.1 hypothetical protein [Nocardiopsis dassonvillei]